MGVWRLQPSDDMVVSGKKEPLVISVEHWCYIMKYMLLITKQFRVTCNKLPGSFFHTQLIDSSVLQSPGNCSSSPFIQSDFPQFIRPDLVIYISFSL